MYIFILEYSIISVIQCRESEGVPIPCIGHIKRLQQQSWRVMEEDERKKKGKKGGEKKEKERRKEYREMWNESYAEGENK